ncbi:hypothetical protein GGI12_001747 [Dipsacomyces acuminosporus]|nr:hypothetical protein GGI12_001747 [Dipsacomyces acuminosporus]
MKNSKDAAESHGEATAAAAAAAEGSDTKSSTDVESAKRNLQALVAAGIHAHGLLGQEGLNDESSSDESDEGDANEGEYEEEIVSGHISGHAGDLDTEQYALAQHQEGNILAEHAEDSHSVLQMHPVHEGVNGYLFSGGASDQYTSVSAADAQGARESHQELLSRVASNFRALIGHGLTTTTTAGMADGTDGLGEGDALDDEEAYGLACEALEHNLRYQRLLHSQLGAIEAAQQRNKELQESIGTLLSFQARASTRRSGKRNKAEKSGQIDPVTGEVKISNSNYFVDHANERPPDNRDTVRKKKHPPIVYRARRWTDAEREALVKGVRHCNRKILSQRMYQQTGDPCSIWEIEKMTDQELEMNLTGLDWKFISKQFVPQHKPVECAIQWATQDHPIINRAPWSKKEEKRLKEIVDQHEGRDWATIAKELDTQRTASQCFQVYQRKLNPDMSRSKWSPEEDRLLTEAVMTYGEGDWQSVAACLDNRTGQQVLHRWCKSINPAIRSGRWDEDEDAALLAAVKLYGVGQWTKIAKHVPGRTDVKCRERYMNVLTPEVNNSQWTPDEDERLIDLVNRVGIGKWSYVADKLGGRTDNQCWRHWRSLNKKGKAPDPPSDLEGESGEEGTVPSFPEWEEERRRRRRQQGEGAAQSGVNEDDSLLNFARTQGTGRKRKTTAGIESARKRQWKRATSTNFVPLLASPPSTDKHSEPATPTRSAQRTPRAKSANGLASRASEEGDYAADETPTRGGPGSGAGRRGRPAKGRLSLPAEGDQADLLSSPGNAASSSINGGGRRASTTRRGRVLNWNNIFQVGIERKEEGQGDTNAHIRPVLPSLGTVQGLQRLVEAVPEVAAAFNAELVGIDDDDNSTPPLDSVPMNWIRQRIETLFIWPLMLGTIDPERKQR